MKEQDYWQMVKQGYMELGNLQSRINARKPQITRQQAEAVASVLREVDGGCSMCVSAACEGMSEIGLGWTWIVAEDANGSVVYAKDGRPVVTVARSP